MNKQTTSAIARSLIVNGYAIFDIDLIDHRPKSIVEGFKKLLEQNQEIRKKWEFFLPEFSKKPDHGLVPPKGDDHDEKWVLMVRASLRNMLMERFTKEEREKYELFLDVFLCETEMVHYLLIDHLMSIAASLDELMPGYAIKEKLENQYTIDHLHCTRIVKYIYNPNAAPSDPMASLHTDQSLLTMQWYQSHPGLVLRDFNNNEIHYKYKPGRVIVFWGKKAIPVLGGKINPVEHWVDSRAGEDRYAAILFAHTTDPSIEMR